MKQSRMPHVEHIRSLIKRDGRINIYGQRKFQERLLDIYHYLFSLSWPRFFIHVLAFYLAINLFFAVIYGLLQVRPSDLRGAAVPFREDFFLSVETLTAIDYGRVAPSSDLTYCLMTLQALLGMLTLATITGLFYARFARPVARLVFSNRAIIGRHDGALCLFFRVANQRLNQIAEARMALTMSRNEISREGEFNRKFYNLKLERDYSPLFALSWTVRHPIDQHSPLHKMDRDQMRQAQMSITASLTGIDETFAQPILSRHVYTIEDLVFDKHFKDIIHWHEKGVHIDLKSIHEVVDDARQG